MNTRMTVSNVYEREDKSFFPSSTIPRATIIPSRRPLRHIESHVRVKHKLI